MGKARLAFSFAVVLGVFAACGGATSSPLLDSSDAGTDGSSTVSDGSATKDADISSLTTCDDPGECELAGAGCCGVSCQSSSKLIAIRRGQAGALKNATCDTSQPVGCPDCEARPDPNFQAFCRSNKCVVVDIRKDDISECSGDDCVLRYAACCQSCGGGAVGNVIAVREGREDDLEEQLCAGNEACEKCLPVFPPTLRAVCDRASRHCIVQGN